MPHLSVQLRGTEMILNNNLMTQYGHSPLRIFEITT